MYRLAFALAWMLLSTAVISTGIATAIFFDWDHSTAVWLDQQPGSVTITTAQSNPSGTVAGVATDHETGDARSIIVANFLKRHNSPLTPHEHFGQVFVDIADENGIDFRLLPAIAMQESNLCKRIPEGSYNCLGFGIHSRGTLKFESYEANFARAARELKANYIDQGRTTPEEIMRKYTPSSNGSWAASVNQWMAEMRYDDRQSGRTLKENGSVLEFVPE
jgi:hypothetical protein